MMNETWRTMTRKQRNLGLAREVRKLLQQEGLWHDVSIYLNGYCYRSGSKEVERDVVASTYCDYTNYDKTVVITFEGPLYSVFNYGDSPDVIEKMQKLFEKYGYYWELGNAWNLCAYDIHAVEEPTKAKPVEPKEPEFDWALFEKACMEACADGCLAAKSVSDEGTCNMDSTFVYLPKGIREQKVQDVLSRCGLIGHVTTWMVSRGVLISPPCSGQGYTRTKGAEAMQKTFATFGFPGTVYYRMD